MGIELTNDNGEHIVFDVPQRFFNVDNDMFSLDILSKIPLTILKAILVNVGLSMEECNTFLSNVGDRIDIHNTTNNENEQIFKIRLDIGKSLKSINLSYDEFAKKIDKLHHNIEGVSTDDKQEDIEDEVLLTFTYSSNSMNDIINFSTRLVNNINNRLYSGSGLYKKKDKYILCIAIPYDTSKLFLTAIADFILDNKNVGILTEKEKKSCFNSSVVGIISVDALEKLATL